MARLVSTLVAVCSCPVNSPSSLLELPGTGVMSGHPLPTMMAMALGPLGTRAAIAMASGSNGWGGG